MIVVIALAVICVIMIVSNMIMYKKLQRVASSFDITSVKTAVDRLNKQVAKDNEDIEGIYDEIDELREQISNLSKR